MWFATLSRSVAAGTSRASSTNTAHAITIWQQRSQSGAGYRLLAKGAAKKRWSLRRAGGKTTSYQHPRGQGGKTKELHKGFYWHWKRLFPGKF
ncbi:hypothetical protein QOT17_011398 [Balamuthia mandrillaris]